MTGFKMALALTAVSLTMEVGLAQMAMPQPAPRQESASPADGMTRVLQMLQGLQKTKTTASPLIKTKTRAKESWVLEKGTCEIQRDGQSQIVPCLKTVALKAALPEGTEVTVDYGQLLPPGYIEQNGKVQFESMPSIGGVVVTGYTPPAPPTPTKGKSLAVTLPAAPSVPPSREIVQAINSHRYFISIVSIESGEIVQRLDPRPLASGLHKIDHPFRWDTHNPQGTWARAVYDTLDQTPTNFVDDQVPSDILDFCPKYESLNLHQRKIVWIGLINEIAYRESLFVPLVANDEGFYTQKNSGVTSRGILQMSYSSLLSENYRNHGCEASSPEQVHDPIANLKCGLAIFSYLIGRDGCISCQRPDGRPGGPSAYWSTLRAPYKLACTNCDGGEVPLGKRMNIIKSMSNRIPMCFDAPIP